ncbi:DUF4367 domain-containing protein [Candidatus Saccharibacteria bacterium]|nr:DUF4367 domain-containing protein [Candidatus Saccharibacteria bacterium]
MSEHVIELNGKRYDAVTGAFLGKSHVIPKHITDRIVHGKAIDGFVRPQAAKPKTETKQAVKETAKAVSPKNRVIVRSTANKARTQANPIKPHTPQASKTLARRHIRKPSFTMKPAIKPQLPVEATALPSAVIRKRSALSVDPRRQQRAASTIRHPAIQRFKTPATHTVVKDIPVIPVSPAPLPLQKPVAAIPVAVPPAQPVKRKEQTKPHSDIFAAAIAKATSHEQPEPKIRRRLSGKRRLANVLAVVGTFLIIGGFITYLNLPGIQMRIASFQAGFSASLPTYTPTGYSLEGGVQRSGNTISLTFRSGDQMYRITQQSSNWNSQTLLDSALAQSGSNPQTIQRNGQIIYIYENEGTNAAWVNGGVRYDLTGNAHLSKDEIAAIATSM